MKSVEALLADARSRLVRATPEQAFADLSDGALLADIRPAAQRREHGEVPGSIVVERNHLEWRFDPSCSARLPLVKGYEQRILVICQQGYTSSLAAAALQDLGLSNATDVVGGFEAWVAAGLPWAPGGSAGVLVAPGASPAALPAPLAGPAARSPPAGPPAHRPPARPPAVIMLAAALYTLFAA